MAAPTPPFPSSSSFRRMRSVRKDVINPMKTWTGEKKSVVVSRCLATLRSPGEFSGIMNSSCGSNGEVDGGADGGDASEDVTGNCEEFDSLERTGEGILISHSLKALDGDKVLSVAVRMRKELGPGKVLDRRWHLKVYKKCFVYSDAMSWLISEVRRRIVVESSSDNQQRQQQKEEEEDAAVPVTTVSSAADDGNANAVRVKRGFSEEDDADREASGEIMKKNSFGIRSGDRGDRMELPDSKSETTSSKVNDNSPDSSTDALVASAQKTGVGPGTGRGPTTDITSTKTMIMSERSIESAAVRLGNLLIDAGYVSHVTKAHRFVIGRSSSTVLYFQFSDMKIDEDLESQRKRQNFESSHSSSAAAAAAATVSATSAVEEGSNNKNNNKEKGKDDLLWEELHALRTNVSHLSEAVISTSQLLHEANGRIVILEAATFLSLAVMLVMVGSYYDALFLEKGLGNSPVLQTALALAMAFFWREFRKTSMNGEKAKNHSVLLEKIAEGNKDETVLGDDTGVEEGNGDGISGRDGSGGGSSGDCASLSSQSSHQSNIKKRFSQMCVDVSERLGSSSSKSKKKTAAAQPLRQSTDIPPPSKWPHRPVMVCINTPVSPSFIVPGYGDGPCPLGVPFQFDSELFEGTALIRFRDVTSDDPDGTASYFDGRSRQFQAIIQGRFKEGLAVSEVLTGHEFSKPLKHLPPQWILGAGTSLVQRKSPGVDIDLHSDRPKFLAILAATAQSVRADMPGNEPRITNRDIDEDCTIFGGDFSRSNVTVSRRKKLLSDPKVSSIYQFDTESIYTFDFYQHMLLVGSYSLDLGFTKIDVSPSLNNQAIQVLAKTATDGRYLWSFQIWHEKLLAGNSITE